MGSIVLLIEDNEQNRYLATFLLEKGGFTVVSAPDGPRGIELAKISSPSIILLDIQLPGLSGYDVALALRSISSLNSVPVVAVTSYAMPGDKEKALESGCNGYIEKPIDPETFVSKISSFIDAGTRL